MANKINFEADCFDISEVGDTVRVALDTQTALTAASVLTVDATWDADAATVVNNLRTRLNEVEVRLKAIGVLPA